VSGIVVHEIPFLEDMGISKVIAAATLGTMMLMSVPSRLASGWLADRWSGKYILVVSAVLQAIGLFIFSRATDMSWIWAFVVIFGIGYGARISLEAVLKAEYFGTKAYGSIYGYMNALAMTGSFAGPFFAGLIFDTTGSYITAFLTFAGMMVAAVLMILPLKSPLKSKYGINLI
jgi:MFS family permease